MVLTLGAGDVAWAGRELLQVRGRQHGLDRRTPFSTETTKGPAGARDTDHGRKGSCLRRAEVPIPFS